MKLHLPKGLLVAVLACSVAQAEVTTAESITVSGNTYTGTVKIMDASADVTAENLVGADYVVVTPDRTELNSSVLSAATEGVLPTIVIATHTTSANAEEVTPGEIFLNAWNTSGIKLDNDFILGSCGHDHGALRLHEAGSAGESIVLTGTVTLAQDAEIGVSTGDYNYLEGAIQADGKKLEINKVNVDGTLNLSGGGTIGELTGDLGNIVFAATKSDGTTAAAGKNYTIGALTTTGALTVQEGVTITLTGGVATANGSQLLSMTGAGNITLSANTTLSQLITNTASTYTSQLTGKLTVNNGATLDLSDDRNDNIYKGDTYDLSSFTSVELDDAIIEYRGQTTSLNNVTVTGNGAKLKVKDVYSANDKFTLAGTTTVNGKLTLENAHWKSHFQIDKLTGDANGEIACAANTDTNDQITIKAFDNYAGKVTGAAKKLNLGLAGADVLNLVAGSSITNSGTTNIYGQLQGSTTISGGTINVMDTASVAGTVVFGSSINLNGTLENTGSITLNGLNVTSTTGLKMVSPEGELTYSDGTNGYIKAQYYLVENSGAGHLEANNLSTYTYADSTLDASMGSITQDTTTGSLLLTLVGAGVYYVNDAETTVSYNAADAEASTTNATGFVLAEGTRLELNSDLSDAVTEGIKVADNTTIKVSKGVSLEASRVSSNIVNEDGSVVDVWVNYEVDGGQLTIKNASKLANLDITNGGKVTVASVWQSIGSPDKNALVRLNDGTLELNNGWAGYIGSPNRCDVLIEEKGTIAGSNEYSSCRLIGSIKGVGELTLTKGSGSQNWEVGSTITDGDNGALSVVKDGDVVITVSGTNTYTGGTTITGGTLTMGNAQALGTAGGVTMSGGTLALGVDAEIKSLNVTGESTLATNAKTLTVNEGISTSSKFIVNGGGTLKVTGNLTTTGTFTLGTTEGTSVELYGTDNSVSIFDLSNQGNAKGQIKLMSGSKTTITSTNTGQGNAGALWMQAGTSILLEEKASLTWLGATVTGKTNGTTISSSANKNVYLEVAEATIDNADVSYNGTAEAYTVAAKLTNSSITQNGSGTLTVNNSGNTLTAVNATGGNVKVINTTENAEMSIADVSAAAGKTVTTEVADLTIGSLTLGTGATLAHTGDLTLNGLTFTLEDYISNPILNNPYTLVSSSGTLELGSSVTMGELGKVGDYTATLDNTGSSLTLTFTQEPAPGDFITTTVLDKVGIEGKMLTLKVEGNLTDVTQVRISGISDSIMADILGLSGLPENGMVGITLQGSEGGEFTATADEMIGFQGNDGSYYFGENVGSAWQYQVAYIPEPATATLSLLALAGLAARRRRK